MGVLAIDSVTNCFVKFPWFFSARQLSFFWWWVPPYIAPPSFWWRNLWCLDVPIFFCFFCSAVFFPKYASSISGSYLSIRIGGKSRSTRHWPYLVQSCKIVLFLGTFFGTLRSVGLRNSSSMKPMLQSVADPESRTKRTHTQVNATLEMRMIRRRAHVTIWGMWCSNRRERTRGLPNPAQTEVCPLSVICHVEAQTEVPP